MGNPGVYGQRRFERLDYPEGIAQAEIATTAIGTNQLKDGAVTAAKMDTTPRTRQIVVQLGAGGASFYLGKPHTEITIKSVKVFGSIGAATTSTTAYLTVSLKKASSGGATTAAIDTVTLTATTANLVKEVSTTGLDATIAATQGLYVVAGATTLVDDNASAIIQFTV